jgi:hypothetical protein
MFSDTDVFQHHDVKRHAVQTTAPAATGTQIVAEAAGYTTTSWDDEDFTRPRGLQRIKPETGKTVRFSVLPYPPVKAMVHFGGQGIGSVICDGSACCDRFDEPRLTAVVLAIKYDNAGPNGKYPLDPKTGQTPAIEYSFGYLSVGKQNFNTLRAIGRDDESLTDIDVLMSYKNPNVPMQGFNFHNASPALWKKNPEVAAEIMERSVPLVEQLPKRLGRPLSALQKNALKAPAGEIGEMEEV